MTSACGRNGLTARRDGAVSDAAVADSAATGAVLDHRANDVATVDDLPPSQPDVLAAPEVAQGIGSR